MKFLLGATLILPLLLAAETLRITDSSRSGSSALRRAALEFALAQKCEIHIDRMAAEDAAKKVDSGSVDIAVFEERDVPDKLKKSTGVFLGTEVLLLYVNVDNPLENLTASDAGKIFSGLRPRWSEFGGRARSIHRVNLKTSSDFSGLDRELFKAHPAAEVLGVNTPHDVIKLVSADSDALGFAPFAPLGAKVKVLKIDRTLPTLENIKKRKYPLALSYRLYVVKSSSLAEKFVEFLKKDIKNQVRNDLWLP